MNGSELLGKVAIITGGASGIGEATARLFTHHGARMVILADIQDELGRKVAQSIGLDKCTYKHCDVVDESQVKGLVESTVQIYGQLDIMFSNAGVLSPLTQTVCELDLDEMDRVFKVNTRGMAACVKHAARAMVANGVRGSIVCTASTTASHGMSVCSDYTMSKHALIGLMRSASVQLGEHGIRVNCVSPNAIPTALACNGLGISVEEVVKRFNDMSRLKGTVLEVKHVADAVLFLASDKSEFITGHDLAVDGGFVPL